MGLASLEVTQGIKSHQWKCCSCLRNDAGWGKEEARTTAKSET